MNWRGSFCHFSLLAVFASLYFCNMSFYSVYYSRGVVLTVNIWQDFKIANATFGRYPDLQWLMMLYLVGILTCNDDTIFHGCLDLQWFMMSLPVS